MNPHLKNTLTLLTGSGISQVIPLISAPILAFYYSPEAFGVFGTFLAVTSTLAILFNLRYDLAIIETKFRVEAYQILKGTFLFGILMMLISYLIIALFLFFSMKDFELRNVILLIPISSFIISQNNAFNAILNRQKLFQERSVLLILNNSGQVIFSLFLKFASKTGLILGNILGGLLILSIHLKKSFKLFSKRKFEYSIFKKFINFPKFILPSTLLEKISTNLPLIFMLDTFGAVNTGLFVFASRITSAPIGMLTLSIGEVYRQRASELFNSGKKIDKLYYQTLGYLILIALVIVVILNSFSGFLIEFFFDEEYYESVKIIKVISIMIGFNLCSTSLSYTIVYANLHRYDTFLQIIRLSLVVISILIGGFYQSFDLFVKSFVLSYCIFYMLHSLLQSYSLRIISNEKRIS